MTSGANRVTNQDGDQDAQQRRKFFTAKANTSWRKSPIVPLPPAA
jgi:hypothetical protein